MIYLKECGDVPHSPFIETSRTGEEIKRLYYKSIELARMGAKEMIQLDLAGLLPLVTLTKDGARHEVVETMIAAMTEAHKMNALWVGYTIASKVMDNDLLWLKRRFSVLGDFLRDTPIYQEVLQEGFEQGIEKGREEGGIQALRQALVELVGMRFPALASLASEQAQRVKDTKGLRLALLGLATLQTKPEIEQYLLALEDDAKKN